MQDENNRDEQIKRRAAELWQQRGSPSGYETEFWSQAERELDDAEKSSAKSANAEGAKSGSGSDGPG
ncbi:MAG: hypothetical protein NVSMB26_12760 [Beijerinckiaceae bacterium]